MFTLVFHTDTEAVQRARAQMNQRHYIKLWFQITGSNQDLNQHTEVFVQYFGSSSVPLERLMPFGLSVLESPKTTCSLFVNFLLTWNPSVNGHGEWLLAKTITFLPSSYAWRFFFHTQLCVLMHSTHQEFSSASRNNIWGPPAVFSPFAQAVPNLSTGKFQTFSPKMSSEWISNC